MASKIYNVPTTSTSAIGSINNPVYRGNLNSPYLKNLPKAQYSMLDYAATCTDFRVLYYALTSKMPSLTHTEQSRLEALTEAQKRAAAAATESKNKTTNQTNSVKKNNESEDFYQNLLKQSEQSTVYNALNT
ncbi:MAG: hypothetical protein E7231_17770 [Cellulosilyticum sp.]|nr:hypothetical protein [Cellulosilyticum sp.]